MTRPRCSTTVRMLLLILFGSLLGVASAYLSSSLSFWWSYALAGSFPIIAVMTFRRFPAGATGWASIIGWSWAALICIAVAFSSKAMLANYQPATSITLYFTNSNLLGAHLAVIGSTLLVLPLRP